MVITQGEAGNSADTISRQPVVSTWPSFSATNFTALSDDPICHTGTYLDDVIIGAMVMMSPVVVAARSLVMVDDTITVGGNDGKAFTTTVDGGHCYTDY